MPYFFLEINSHEILWNDSFTAGSHISGVEEGESAVSNFSNTTVLCSYNSLFTARRDRRREVPRAITKDTFLLSIKLMVQINPSTWASITAFSLGVTSTKSSRKQAANIKTCPSLNFSNWDCKCSVKSINQASNKPLSIYNLKLSAKLVESCF